MGNLLETVQYEISGYSRLSSASPHEVQRIRQKMLQEFFHDITNVMEKFIEKEAELRQAERWLEAPIVEALFSQQHSIQENPPDLPSKEGPGVTKPKMRPLKEVLESTTIIYMKFLLGIRNLF